MRAYTTASQLRVDGSDALNHHRIAACLICRFILSLRSVYQKKASIQHADGMSSIDFALRSIQGTLTARAVGNMGAPLHVGGLRSDEVEETEQFTSDPFNFGLVQQNEEHVEPS